MARYLQQKVTYYIAAILKKMHQNLIKILSQAFYQSWTIMVSRLIKFNILLSLFWDDRQNVVGMITNNQ